MEVSNFDVLKQMSADNNQTFKLSNNLEGVRKVKAGFIVEIGVDHNTGQDIQNQMVFGSAKHMVVLLVVDIDEFNKTKNKLIQATE